MLVSVRPFVCDICLCFSCGPLHSYILVWYIFLVFQVFSTAADNKSQVAGIPPVPRGMSQIEMTSDIDQHNTMNILRPLSPHLPIYRPQVNSTFSIVNRISGAFLSTIVLCFYFICLKTGLICFNYYNFYQFLFYSSKLILTSIDVTAALALAYHLFYGVRHLLHWRISLILSNKESSNQKGVPFPFLLKGATLLLIYVVGGLLKLNVLVFLFIWKPPMDAMVETLFYWINNHFFLEGDCLFIWQLPINILRLRPFHCCCCSLAPLCGWRTTWTCSLLFSSSVTSVEKKWGLRVPSCLQW